MRALITGGAGFIGSRLATSLLRARHEVLVLDDLSTGHRSNIPPHAKFLPADIADEEAIRAAVDGVDVVFHQAARRAVPRSVSDPVGTDMTNVHGTVVLLKACADAGVSRVIFASSSSLYGDCQQEPVTEAAQPKPRSPYAVSKLAGEWYCRLFSELYGLETISLRYFNVYGPGQRPDCSYAMVIPLFLEALMAKGRPMIHGDGLQSRSFTYIDDVVKANIAATEAPYAISQGHAYNIAGPKAYTLLELVRILSNLLEIRPTPVHSAPRPGDVRHINGDSSLADRLLGCAPTTALEDGLRRTIASFRLASFERDSEV